MALYIRIQHRAPRAQGLLWSYLKDVSVDARETGDTVDYVNVIKSRLVTKQTRVTTFEGYRPITTTHDPKTCRVNVTCHAGVRMFILERDIVFSASLGATHRTSCIVKSIRTRSSLVSSPRWTPSVNGPMSCVFNEDSLSIRKFICWACGIHTSTLARQSGRILHEKTLKLKLSGNEVCYTI